MAVLMNLLILFGQGEFPISLRGKALHVTT